MGAPYALKFRRSPEGKWQISQNHLQAVVSAFRIRTDHVADGLVHYSGSTVEVSWVLYHIKDIRADTNPGEPL